jgi:hypothetical protein
MSNDNHRAPRDREASNRGRLPPWEMFHRNGMLNLDFDPLAVRPPTLFERLIAWFRPRPLVQASPLTMPPSAASTHNSAHGSPTRGS